MANHVVVFIRHGESDATDLGFCGGWHDSDLSDIGVEEAKLTGQILKEKGYTFDIAFTCLLKRAVKTLYYVQEELDLHWIPVVKHWRLNCRHKGILQGIPKQILNAKYGREQLLAWRKTYDVSPPPLDRSDPRWPGKDRRYADVEENDLPGGESLKNTVDRALPYWKDVIEPVVRSGKRVLISTHGSIMRGVVKHLENIPDSEIGALYRFASGMPLVYYLDDDMRPIERFLLTDNKGKAPIPDLKINSHKETYEMSEDRPSTLEKITNGYH